VPIWSGGAPAPTGLPTLFFLIEVFIFLCSTVNPSFCSGGLCPFA